MMVVEFLELSRCRDGESVEDTKSVLDAAGIAYRLASTAPCFDLSSIGTGSDPEVIISVRSVDYEAARTAMEEDFLKVDLPDDHYLLTSSDHELAEILGKPSEWSPFDVAHARRLALERGVDLEQIESQKRHRLEKLKRGKPASRKLLLAGWIFSALGGFFGVGIAWSICYMKEKTPEGEFYTYDARSRDIGKGMLFFSILVLCLAALVKLYFLKYEGIRR
jgi:hypothetical protein